MSAGSSVNASTTAVSVTAMPPIAIERSTMCGNANSPMRLAATVMPENATARPVVVTAFTSAQPEPRRGTSSRKRFRMNSE